MTDKADKNPWWLVAVGTVLTAILTTGLTVWGNYWLEERKAKIDLAKEVSKTQASALDKLDRDLSKLNGNVFWMSKIAHTTKGNSGLQKQASETANVLIDLLQDNKSLDDTFEAKNLIRDLNESLAPILANISENPAKGADRLRSYQSAFSDKVNAARVGLDNDRKRVLRALH